MKANLERSPFRGTRVRPGFWADEEGASYSLNHVMTIPLVALVLMLFIEATLIINSTVGTTYAAFAAARAAIVWSTAWPADVAERRIRLAATHATVPFGSGNPLHSPAAGGLGFEAYLVAYRRYTDGGPLGDRYLSLKYLYAERATTLVVSEASRWDSDLTATVTFEHPIQSPIIGRFLGHPAPWGSGRFFTFTISQSVTLRNEGPKNDRQTLGIPYVSE